MKAHDSKDMGRIIQIPDPSIGMNLLKRAGDRGWKAGTP